MIQIYNRTETEIYYSVFRRIKKSLITLKRKKNIAMDNQVSLFVIKIFLIYTFDNNIILITIIVYFLCLSL